MPQNAMSDSRELVIWPISKPSPAVKQLISHFFALVDTNSQDVGQVLADEIFTQDGVFITANAMFQGVAEIRHSREGAWTTVKTRKHTILKCYENDAHGTDLLLIGKLELETLAGTKTNVEFVARIKIEEREFGPRISKYQVISPAPQVSQPIIMEPK